MDRVKLSADTATTKKQITLYEKKNIFLLLECKNGIYYKDTHTQTHRYLSVHPLMLVPPILAEYIPEKQH